MNKGKPTKQVPDQRAEAQKDNGASTSPRTAHRGDRSRDTEKGGKGADSGLDSKQRTLRHPDESAKLPRSKINH